MDSSASKIIEQISALDSNDDGIKANQKYKHILSVIQTECSTAKQLREVYQQLNEQSLKDAEFALKFAMLGSSRLFQTLELFGQKIKSLMLAVLRENYENLDTLRDTCIDGFYNSITLFGEYYNRARLSDGSPMKNLVPPLIEYFKDMLRMNTERSAKEFTTQITLNGEIMNKTHPDELADLMLLVRKQMLSADVENESVRIWLMLCVDLSHSHFRVIDAKLERFYDETLKAAEKLKKQKGSSDSKREDAANNGANVKKNDGTSTKTDATNMQNDVANTEDDATNMKQNDAANTKNDTTNMKNDAVTTTRNAISTKNVSNVKNDATNVKTDSNDTKNDVANVKNDAVTTARNAISTKNGVANAENIATANKNNELAATNTEVSSSFKYPAPVKTNDDKHEESRKTVDDYIDAKDVTNLKNHESPERSTPSISNDSGVVADDKNTSADTSLSNTNNTNTKIDTRPTSRGSGSFNNDNTATSMVTGKSRNDVQIYRPPRFRINSGGQTNPNTNNWNTPENDKNTTTKTNFYNSDNNSSTKNTSSSNWAPHDQTSKQFSYFRSRSNDKISPPSNKIKSWADEVEDYNNGISDGQRKQQQTINNHQQQPRIPPNNSRPQSKLLSPRDRIRAQLPPRQVLLKQNNSCAVKQDATFRNSSSGGNHGNSHGAFATAADGGGGGGRYGNDSSAAFGKSKTVHQKPVKAYLRDENVENLTWNQTGADIHEDFYPAPNDISPRFLSYLQRN